MSEGTNENGSNYVGNEKTVQNSIENAFSDLISEYFGEESNTQNTVNYNSGVNNGLYTNLTGTETQPEYGVNNAGTIPNGESQYNLENVGTNNNGILYNNLENTSGSTIENGTNYNVNSTVGYGDDSSYWDTPIYNTVTGETTIGTSTTSETATPGITGDYGTVYNGTETDGYNTSNNETIAQNAYGVITVNGDVLKGVNSSGVVGNNVQDIITTGTESTDFKLTQGNLPAKIGFWTKVRNFFISDSKISYSVEQAGTPNTGLWNKLQNFFSFGKNK